LSRITRGPGSGLIGFVLGLIVAAVGVFAYTQLHDDSDPVTEARSVIEDNYFKATDSTQLNDDSINGMVNAIKKRYDDKFSHYFNPEQLKAFESSTSGRFSGVGLTVTEVPRGLRVARVFPDTPAARQGLRVGDVIIGVNGESIKGVSSDVSTAKIKGPAGTDVDLRIDPVSGPPRNVTLERADVRIPAVEGRLVHSDGHKLGYIYFGTFSAGAHGELRNELERLYRAGAEGAVLDLRGNGGGLLNEAVLCASIFIDHGVIVSTESRTQGDRSYDAVGDAIDPHPMVVLVDDNTASAAEILTAAMKYYDVATVVGTHTYGKGTFQEVIHLPSGGALDLTIGQYLPADGKSILGTGVKPEVHAVDNPHTPKQPPKPPTNNALPLPPQDEGLDKALQVLDQKL
jgi:carboxyl-terminal processing protease